MCATSPVVELCQKRPIGAGVERLLVGTSLGELRACFVMLCCWAGCQITKALTMCLPWVAQMGQSAC
eukprot:3462884-Amphidinium_carterae.2